jgi:hypothetical protein
MGWAKFSDDTHANEHILPLSHAAFRLWVSSVMDNRGYKDGRSPFISTARAEALCRQQRIPRRSIKDIEVAGRWEPTEGGWNIHDYSKYLPSRREDQEDRELDPVKQAAGLKGAAARWHTDGTPDGRPMAEGGPASSRPVAPRAPARVVPVPVPVPVPDVSKEVRGDMHVVGSNGTAPPSPQIQVLRLLDWLMARHGWSTWSSPDTQKREASLAVSIIELAIPHAQLYSKLEDWWQQSDPDDRPSSLGYFWTRLQDEAHAALKATRPHAGTSGPTKITPVLPAKGAK